MTTLHRTLKTLQRRVQAIEAQTAQERLDAEERASRERDAIREAYLRSPAGREMARHLAGMARGYCVAVSYEQHPDYYHDAAKHFARPRFESGLCDAGEHCGALVGTPAKPWCSCGLTSDEIAADLMAAVEEAQRLADAWDAAGRPES